MERDTFRLFGGNSNLPPGVTDSMIPGNRPEDIEWEKRLDKLTDFIWQKVGNLNLSFEEFDILEKLVDKFFSEISKKRRTLREARQQLKLEV